MKVKVFGTNATVFVHFLGRDNFPIDYNQKVQSTEHTQYSQQVISKGTRFMEHATIALHGKKKSDMYEPDLKPIFTKHLH